MNDVTKQLILELSVDLFRDAIKAHYHHGVQPGASLNFHNIASDSIQAAESFYRVANQELYTPESGCATAREAYWWAFTQGFETGSKGLPLNEPDAQAKYADAPELLEAFANGWHTGDMRRTEREKAKTAH